MMCIDLLDGGNRCIGLSWVNGREKRTHFVVGITPPLAMPPCLPPAWWTAIGVPVFSHFFCSDLVTHTADSDSRRRRFNAGSLTRAHRQQCWLHSTRLTPPLLTCIIARKKVLRGCVRSIDSGKLCKYVYLTTNQLDTKYNPNHNPNPNLLTIPPTCSASAPVAAWHYGAI